MRRIRLGRIIVALGLLSLAIEGVLEWYWCFLGILYVSDFSIRI